MERAKTPCYDRLRERFPTVDTMRDYARAHAPHFAFEYADGGAGCDAGTTRNRTALDAIELLPRYGAPARTVSTEVSLFDQCYAAPIAISPMGTPGIVLPGADRFLAQAAQAARVPYTLGMIGGATVEEMATLAPDVLWFQMLRCSLNDHTIAFDLMRRADACGVRALVLTMDVPVYTTRPRATLAGLGGSRFSPNARMMWDIATSPAWFAALLANGIPRFANLKKYMPPSASINDVIAFTQREIGGAFSWEEVARYRDFWKRPLVIKGILHPQDAEKAVSLGADGIIVSNHGGRQVDALPASVDCLPDIVKAVAGRTTIFLDSGIRSGSDIVRALALGANATFAGKAFLWSLSALGAEGPAHTIRILQEETRATLAQLGAASVADAQQVMTRHTPRSWAALR